MFERLAELAQRRGKWVLVVAAVLFVAAGAFGAGVASHLAPYGADDPATESIRADRLLERAGFRETGVVVLVDGIDANSAAGRERIRAIERKLDARPRRRRRVQLSRRAAPAISSRATATPPTSP